MNRGLISPLLERELTETQFCRGAATALLNAAHRFGAANGSHVLRQQATNMIAAANLVLAALEEEEE